MNNNKLAKTHSVDLEEVKASKDSVDSKASRINSDKTEEAELHSVISSRSLKSSLEETKMVGQKEGRDNKKLLKGEKT